MLEFFLFVLIFFVILSFWLAVLWIGAKELSNYISKRRSRGTQQIEEDDDFFNKLKGYHDDFE